VLFADKTEISYSHVVVDNTDQETEETVLKIKKNELFLVQSSTHRTWNWGLACRV